MGIKDVLKVSRKTFFNPRAWLGYDYLRDQTRYIWSSLKEVSTPRQAEYTETFEEAMQRLKLNEKQIKARAKLYFYYVLFFLILSVSDFLYGFYLLFHHGAFLGLVLAFAVCALLLAQAFKYHFWYFQIKHRKLGCTLKEWRKEGLLW